MKAEEVRKLAEIPANRPGAQFSPGECAEVVAALFLFAGILERIENARKKNLKRQEMQEFLDYLEIGKEMKGQTK